MRPVFKACQQRHYYFVAEGSFKYTMPYVLRHKLEKYLLDTKEIKSATPIADWYQNLPPDHRNLMEVSTYTSSSISFA